MCAFSGTRFYCQLIAQAYSFAATSHLLSAPISQYSSCMRIRYLFTYLSMSASEMRFSYFCGNNSAFIHICHGGMCMRFSFYVCVCVLVMQVEILPQFLSYH